MKLHRRIQIKNRTIHHLAAGLFTALVLNSCLPATVAAAEPPLTAVERAAHFEESLLRAKASGKDIVVLQRGSDWNRLGEMLYHEVWLKDEFARELGGGFILMTVDLPEQEGARALQGLFSPADGALSDRVKPVPVSTPSRRIETLAGGETPLPANEVTLVESPGGAIFKQRTDGTWVAEGPNPVHDILTLKLKTAGGGQVLRLDFPTDPSQPGGGPGRAGNGNFVLTEVEMQSGATPMKLTAAWSNAGSRDARVAIDGISDQNDKHWSGDGHHHVRRTLLLAMPEPVAAEAELTVRLFCRSPWGFHMPGCLRAAVLPDPGLREDLVQAVEAQLLKAKNSGYSWWDTTYCPRVALLDSEGRAVACENKPRRGLTPATLAARVKELRAVREKRDALWARAESAQGPEQADLLRQGLDVMGFANWAGNANCYRPIHDRIRAADPKDESGAVRWLTFGRDPRDGFQWTEPSWSKALEKPELTDEDFKEALARIDKELKDPRNRIFDHERIQRIMIAKYHLYARWPEHQEHRFDVQREIAALDPDTFWGIGARGELGLRYRSATPMLTYGWAANQVKPGLNAWDMTDTAYFFDHAGPYKIRLKHTGGKDGLQVRRVALLDGATVLAEAKPDAGLSSANASVEVDLDFKDWRAGRKVTLRVELEAADGQTDSNGAFTVDPLLLPVPPLAAQPAATDELSAMLTRGEIAALQHKLGDALMAVAKDASGKSRVADSADLRASLAQSELIRVCGAEKVAAIAAHDGGAWFLQSFFKDNEWLESFLASGNADWPQALENLYVLHRYGSGWDGPLSQRLATALALQWGNGLRYRLVDRFRQIQQALRDGLMHISFESLNVREMRRAVPTYGTAKDFQFLLDDRQTRLRDYLGAHGAVRYVSYNVYGVSVQDQWNYIAPWTHFYGTGTGSRPFTAHRQVGGVCGTLSTYAPSVAQVHGIPGMDVGQPGHCAHIIRVGQEWPVGNSVTWPTTASAPGWDGTGYPTLHRLYEPVVQDRERFMAATRLVWLARLQAERLKIDATGALTMVDTGWMRTFDQAIAAQPSNYGTWLDYVKMLETVKDLPAATWLDVARRAARDLAVGHEAGWAIVRRCLDKALPRMTPAERLEVLVACNRELRQENWVKPVHFPYDGTLNWQVDRLGDPLLAVEFFGKLLAIHHSPEAVDNWIFGSVLSWGQRRFAGNPATAPTYAKAMEGFFKSQGDTADKNLLTTTIATGIRKASESGDIASYHLWNDMAAQMLPPIKPEDVHFNAAQAAAAPKYMPFPGDLLSKDGMLQTSSACGSDRPLSYSQVLSDGFGGFFDTNNEEKPWAQVQLPGEGELSGIVLLNRYEYALELPWAVPLKVSFSLDGKTWTEVASFDKADMVFRVDLQGKGVKARYVRIERLPGADKTQAPGRFHFRNFLVYGRKLY